MMLLAGLVMIWAGCSVEKNYALLSFFFDGVPDPNSPAPGSGGMFARQRGVDYVIHKPFDEGQCQECHTDFSDLGAIRGNSNVCLKCHGDVPTQFTYMHGPVAAVNCLWCHQPHQSTVKALLRQEAPALCQRCHNDRVLKVAHPDKPADAVANCLECHDGHGGSARYFLKPDAGSASPGVLGGETER